MSEEPYHNDSHCKYQIQYPIIGCPKLKLIDWMNRNKIKVLNSGIEK